MLKAERLALIGHLQTYVMLQPDHTNGLCHWLFKRGVENSYTLVQKEIDNTGAYTTEDGYLSAQDGFTVEREFFAQRWINHLIIGLE